MAPYIMYRKEEELNTKGFLFGEVRPKWAKFKEEGGQTQNFYGCPLWMVPKGTILRYIAFRTKSGIHLVIVISTN